MNHDDLRESVAAFVQSPTGVNRDALLAAADRYRDWWIEAQTSGQGAHALTPAPRSVAAFTGTPSGSAVPPTSYDKEMSTRERVVDGIPVKLVLQERTSVHENLPWWVISWRTRLRPGGPNRRFYKTQNQFWRLPAKVALDLMHELRDKGGLQPQFDDHRGSSLEVIVSSRIAPAERDQLLREITGPGENWGSNPFFVIAADPNPKWRKVMIVDPDTGTATFRSLTKSTSYRPRTELRPGCEWSLDNSMMDTGAEQMRAFLENLSHLLEK
jgi:hypothetical protein